MSDDRRAPPGWEEETERIREKDIESAQRYDDLKGLARRFDFLAAEVREGFNMMASKILPMLERIDASVTELAARVSDLEVKQIKTDDRLSEIEESLKRRKARRKRS